MADYLDSWLSGKRRLRDTTRRSYASHVRRYLGPGVGSIKLADLRPHQIDVLYSDLIEGRYPGATAATVHHVHRTLRSALNSAVKRRLIPWNPALHVELPERHRKQTTVWAPEEVGRFLDASSSHRLCALFHLIAFTGLRRGEALGLHWSDVDFSGPHIVVRWQVIDAGKGPQLGEPKTAAGARRVPIDQLTAQVLRDHRTHQEKERADWGDGWQETGLVFTRENGAILRPDSITHLFMALVRRRRRPDNSPPRPEAHACEPGARRRRRHEGRQQPPWSLDDKHHGGPLHPRHSGRGPGSCRGHRSRDPATFWSTCKPIASAQAPSGVRAGPSEGRFRWSGGAPATGLEPVTVRLKVGCAANCATPAYVIEGTDTGRRRRRAEGAEGDELPPVRHLRARPA